MENLKRLFFIVVFLPVVFILDSEAQTRVSLVSSEPSHLGVGYNPDFPLVLNFNGPVNVARARGTFYAYEWRSVRGRQQLVRGRRFPAMFVPASATRVFAVPIGCFPFSEFTMYELSASGIRGLGGRALSVTTRNIVFITGQRPVPGPNPTPTPTPPPGGDPLDRALISKNNFTYLGAIALPTTANGWSTSYSAGGLAHRTVNGELRFFTTSHVYSGGLIYETNAPEFRTTPPYNTASVVRNWGDVYSGKKVLFNGGGSNELNGGNPTNGIYYDQALNRLYWAYGHWYNTENTNNPSFGYSTLDDNSGVATGVGAWNFVNRGEKFVRGGLVRIPEWFATRFTGGRSLGVGLGGYYSIIASGSAGIAVTAVSDPDINQSPHSTSLNHTPLVGYPFSAPDRMSRNADYTSFYDGGSYPTTPGAWNPSGGVGKWTWSDMFRGSAVWIDNLPNVHGLLVIGKIGHGNVWYEGSTLHAERGSFSWFVYNPRDLSKTASGQLEQWQVQPQAEWTDSNLPLPSLDQNGWGGEGWSVVSASYDESTKRLYVLVTMSYQNGVEWYPYIHAFQLS